MSTRALDIAHIAHFALIFAASNASEGACRYLPTWNGIYHALLYARSLEHLLIVFKDTRSSCVAGKVKRFYSRVGNPHAGGQTVILV